MMSRTGYGRKCMSVRIPNPGIGSELLIRYFNILVAGTSIRIDEEQHSHLINKTEHVPVLGMEEDYILGLDVFHQLHCLVSE